MNQILVCFAVLEEAKFLKQMSGPKFSASTLITGIGQANAEKSINDVLSSQRPSLVLSSGFAGGLRPNLETGTVLFSGDTDSGLHAALVNAGAKPGQFHCSKRIITTAKDKQRLWKSTDADAVEMESQFIYAVCRKQNIPCATVRVILDTATEDLPLDFNRMMNARQEMSYGKLVLALMKSPRKIGELLKLQKHMRIAARSLAQVLFSAINACGCRE